MSRKICWLLVLTAGALLGGAAHGQETYPIKLNFPSKVGDKYHLRAQGSSREETVTSLGARTKNATNATTVELEANIEVLEVDPGGHEKRIACTVETCTVGIGGPTRAPFEKGDVLIVSAQDRKQIFLLNSKEVSRETEAALRIVLTTHTTTVDDDDIFGSRTPRKIGESWPINSKAAIADLNERGNPFVPRSLEGQTILRGVKSVNGKSCLDISGTMKARDIDMPARPGVKLIQATMEASFDGLFPVGQSRIRESMSAKAAMKMEAQTPNGTITSQLMAQQTAVRELESK